MSLNDPIADMLTIIRNSARQGHEVAMVKRSKMTLAVLGVLKQNRFIYDFKSIEDNKQGSVRIYLRVPETAQDGGRRVRKINRLARVSKPGHRVYTPSEQIPRVLNGLGLCVISTSKGVMSGDDARRHRVGGEVLCTIY